jgi:antitoxin MazE
MKTMIIAIGNSRGVRIPKAVLEQCHIEKEAIMDVEKGSIVIKPAKQEPRKDWDGYFKQMKKLKEDNLLISDNVDLVMKEWEW